jgi:uncharacterized tellurite resistance protein B-like protein
MSFTDYISNHGRKVSKQAFVHLVQVSKADGKLNQDEFNLLYSEGKKFGLTDPEIDELIASEGSINYTAPYSLEEKFEHLYNMGEMILADGVVDESERKIIRRFALEVGFREEKLVGLAEIMIEGIQANTDEEVLFRKFKKYILE